LRHGQNATQAADDALRLLTRQPVVLVSSTTLLPLAWALRNVVSMADAFYLACAMLAGCPLATRDRRLARAAVQWGVDVQ